MKYLIVIFSFLFFSTSLHAQNDRIKVLIIDGYSNHDWRYTTEVIKTMLVNSGFCEVDISTAPTNNSPDYNSWNPDFSKYDVVVQNVNSLGNGNSWPKQVQTKFENYMKNGGGMYVFHSANNSFPEWVEYNKMIGLGWRNANQGVAIEIKDNKMVKIPSSEGENTSHGPRVDLVVNVLKSHPINNRFPAKWKTPDIELYTYARGPAVNIEILSYTLDTKTNKNWPVDWVVNYGKGRVYNSTFGHLWNDLRMPPSVQCVGFQTTFLRAIQWVAGKKVTVEVPKNFPSENEVSLNPFGLVYDKKDGWEDLFNGKNLDGWEIKCQPKDRGKEFWAVKNGVIECNSIGKPDHNYFWLMHKNEYSDFNLRLKFQIFKSSTGNSGVQFRSRYDSSETAREGGWLNGPQVDIHPPTPFRAGLIYDETDAVNRWIHPSKPDWKIGENDVPKAALQTKLVYADENPDAWNTMEIVCEGMKIRTFVNGKLVTNFDATGILDDAVHKEKNVGSSGQIALQLHSSDELLIRYKDLKIREHKMPGSNFTKNSIQKLQEWYNPETGLWETTGWWNSANALTGIIRYSAVTGDKSFVPVIENTFQKTKKFTIPVSDKQEEKTVENYINEYYDDEGWWALAWIEAYDFTGERKYLEMAKTIFEDMKTGWDEKCGGGIYWKKGLPYKSAISNELFMLLAARLAMRDENKPYYLEWALKEWNWFSQTGMINDLPLVHDGVHENCTASGRHYTYNQGVILAALVDLQKLTGDEKYITLATRIALAAIQNMSTSEGVLKGHPKQEDGADGVQFKGIFMRHLAYLFQQTNDKTMKEFILKNAKSIQISASKKETCLIGSQWEGPFDSADAGRQSSAIDALVSALEVVK